MVFSDDRAGVLPGGILLVIDFALLALTFLAVRAGRQGKSWVRWYLWGLTIVTIVVFAANIRAMPPARAASFVSSVETWSQSTPMSWQAMENIFLFLSVR